MPDILTYCYQYKIAVELIYKPSCELVVPIHNHLHPYPGEAGGSCQTKLHMLAEKKIQLTFVEWPFSTKVQVGEATLLPSW